MRRVISLLLLLTLALLSFASCAEESTGESSGSEYLYDPYYNRFKPDVPTGSKIAVSGKTFYYSELQVRDKDEIKLVEDEMSLEIMYTGVYVSFISEDTVKIVDHSRFFNVPETKGVREGNVLTVENTNKTGDYTYDIRIEIHEDEIYVTHNAHHYNDPCTYTTVTFTLDE